MSANVIAVRLVDLNPMFGHWVHAHADVLFPLMVALWIVGSRLAAMSTEDLERVIGAEVYASILRLNWSLAQAADVMGVPLENLRKTLKCAEAPNGAHHQLSLYKLARMPFEFWLDFLPSLSAVVIAHHVRQVLASGHDMVQDARQVVERRRA